ncbi:hypothetical protein HY837_02735, partial [archaeon]|nr:hypothetical protein [archaeon]
MNDQKRDEIGKKQSISKQIISLITSNKKLREERDKLTSEVKVLKEKRKTLNQEITKRIEEVKKFNEEKKKLAQKHGIKEDPSRIQKQIEALEFKIETEVFSFDKERELNKVVKDLKKQLIQSKEVSDIWSKSHELSKSIDKLKEESDKFHREIQQKAQESQKKHELIIDNNKK